jgi:hypothetical protein
VPTTPRVSCKWQRPEKFLANGGRLRRLFRTSQSVYCAAVGVGGLARPELDGTSFRVCVRDSVALTPVNDDPMYTDFLPKMARVTTIDSFWSSSGLVKRAEQARMQGRMKDG